MRTLTLFCLLLTATTFATAQKTPLNFSEKQTPIWELAKKRTMEVAEAMPENLYDYRPTEDVMSFREQMSHITGALLSMDTRFIRKQEYAGYGKDLNGLSKADLIKEMSKTFDQVIANLKKLDDTALTQTGKDFGGVTLTKWQSYLFMQDHITNHRAKAVLYLRLNKITPPRYGYN
ncbi:hypothetical protein FUAX_34200 [Fulvitalea axinellae]|uniref:DinB-like domain-containing protein n=1 Tax=Fulvitalea axinellae TaxID=1182444 RepID=A0AAU9D4S2_9BACT|nr:hypothetical protein FUAX_34200 [Fulvitalea axinellae]